MTLTKPPMVPCRQQYCYPADIHKWAFVYAFKFGIITNGFGIVRDVSFYNKDFLEVHPDIVVEKKSAPLMRISLVVSSFHTFSRSVNGILYASLKVALVYGVFSTHSFLGLYFNSIKL